MGKRSVTYIFIISGLDFCFQSRRLKSFPVKKRGSYLSMAMPVIESVETNVTKTGTMPESWQNICR